MSADAIFASPWGALVIFCLRIVDVSCDTMRVIFAIRGKRNVAAALGFVQALVWIVAVGNAVKHLDSVLHVLGYAGGYAMGTYVGVTLEQALPAKRSPDGSLRLGATRPALRAKFRSERSERFAASEASGSQRTK